MFISERVASLIVDDFNEQNISALHRWSLRYPEYLAILENKVSVTLIKKALIEHKTLLLAYLLKQPNLSQRAGQLVLFKDKKNSKDEHILLGCHILDREKDKNAFLTELQGRISLQW